jgi:hypothetical protein
MFFVIQNLFLCEISFRLQTNKYVGGLVPAIVSRHYSPQTRHFGDLGCCLAVMPSFAMALEWESRVIYRLRVLQSFAMALELESGVIISVEVLGSSGLKPNFS